jgi:hypothetical protein
MLPKKQAMIVKKVEIQMVYLVIPPDEVLKEPSIIYVICTEVVDNATLFSGLTETFFRSPFIPYPKAYLSTAFTTTRETDTCNKDYKS